jgi:four helix bundle protein
MPASKSFEDVLVWQKAYALVLAIYGHTAKMPKHELFGLTAQLRRAAVSVPANFAEGFKRHTRPEKLHFYNIAQASLEECRYYLRLAQDLEYGNTVMLRESLQEISQMLESCAENVRQAESRSSGRPSSY